MGEAEPFRVSVESCALAKFGEVEDTPYLLLLFKWLSQCEEQARARDSPAR